MDFGGDSTRPRVVGDYVIGRRIGSGSFAVVWKARHRHLGTEFAVKEIDKRHLNDKLRKEILILGNIDHPNIIRLFEAIETEDRIFIVLEYCDGGDLAAYLNRHGRVQVEVARHFMRQLAAGLKVLRENNLIHRDLKPQNLLLSSKSATMSLKIADFGFARYLTPHGLADTLCGSPLYMAPEIIQNHKYDAKADLWSVGAILFQLVTGRPPYGGNSQFELFQNILASPGLQFPRAALEVLDPDCVELCRRLLRHNPVERLTFEEFFNHKFLVEPRVKDVQRSHSNPPVKPQIEVIQHELKDEKMPHPDDDNISLSDSSGNDERIPFSLKGHKNTSSAGDNDPSSSSQAKASDSMELIEREYVLVNSVFASMETLTSSYGGTVTDSSNAIGCGVQPEKEICVMSQMNEIPPSSLGSMGNSASSVSDTLASSSTPCIAREPQGEGTSHSARRLQFLLQCAHALSELARDKINTRLFLESFSVELVVLAIWKEVIGICFSWRESNESPQISSSKGISDLGPGHSSSSNIEDSFDFSRPSSILARAERAFILTCERAEKLSKNITDTDGTAEMPDAMEVIYQTALDSGKSGAADELVENHGRASTSYSKAVLFLSFILAEAPLLPLNPPFTLSTEDKRRIVKYIRTLESHWTRSRNSQILQRQLQAKPPPHTTENR